VILSSRSGAVRSYGVGMRRPKIGICTALERAQWSVWDQQAVLLPRSYVDAVQRAGAMALLLPPDAHLTEDPGEALEAIDGLLLAGGADIDPASYGAERHVETVDTVPERDAFEIALVQGALACGIPVLGICRGMQLINVAHGGTLMQHLPERMGHHEHCRVPGTFEDADHDVRLLEGSLAAQAAGETEHATKSHHHQGVDRVGEGLRVSGYSVLDDLPEAIELAVPAGAPALVEPQDGVAPPFLLGVQWHPEADESSTVVKALVQAAAARDWRGALAAGVS
jgi:putative glutamine amidotransferase